MNKLPIDKLLYNTTRSIPGGAKYHDYAKNVTSKETKCFEYQTLLYKEADDMSGN